MAGVEAVKTTVSKVAHQGAHYDEQRRATANHSNKHIDQSKTHLNYNIGANTWREMMNNARDLVKEIDAKCPPKRKKDDRKTMVVFDIYCPNTIQDDQAFFTRFYEEYEKAYPQSLMGMQVHVDEQHEYLDPYKKEIVLSMKHGHCFAIPNDAEKGINMKNFLNKAWYNKVNEICEEIAREFGTTYHTGEGHHEDRDMEQMKAQSVKELLKYEEYVAQSVDSLENAQNRLIEGNRELKATQVSLTQENASISAEISSKKEELEKVYNPLFTRLTTSLEKLGRSGMFIQDDVKREHTQELGNIGYNYLNGIANKLKQKEHITEMELDDIADITEQLEDELRDL